MTVEEAKEDGRLLCRWFDQNKLCAGLFVPDTLTKIGTRAGN